MELKRDDFRQLYMINSHDWPRLTALSNLTEGGDRQAAAADYWTDGGMRGKMGTFLRFHRLLLNLSQPLQDFIFLTLYPLLLFLGISAHFLFFLQLSPAKLCNDMFQKCLWVRNIFTIWQIETHIKSSTWYCSQSTFDRVLRHSFCLT